MASSKDNLMNFKQLLGSDMKRYLVHKIGFKGMNKIIFSLGSLITISLLLVSSSSYAVPNIISYQGVLNDASGNPGTNTVEMTFSIYDVETGGAARIQNILSVCNTQTSNTTSHEEPLFEHK